MGVEMLLCLRVCQGSRQTACKRALQIRQAVCVCVKRVCVAGGTPDLFHLRWEVK